MASDYRKLCRENKRRYGTDVSRWGRRVLAECYSDRTHFIYELLQNAEDALAKREGRGQCSVHFELSEREIRIHHFGEPFDSRDVYSICNILISTKDEDITQIGRFGTGFKSVYAFTDRPEVHSGGEDFVIKDYVHPFSTDTIQCDPNETVIIMPLKDPAKDRVEIETGLKRLGPSSLLFLHEIKNIRWNVEGGSSGRYFRHSKKCDDWVRRVTIAERVKGKPNTEETWLVFSKQMRKPEGGLAGHVELAFSLKEDKERERVQAVSHSPLVVFFPTVVETNLGFRAQGPYRTTPIRETVNHSDSWNQSCVEVTAELLIEALVWLRDKKLLDVGVLQCLPLEQEKFGEDSMFAPLYEKTKQALISQRLLPRFKRGYATAGNAKLARTQELRELFNSAQLTWLFASKQKLTWLTGDISQDRTPKLRWYLMNELKVAEVTPEVILPKLSDVAFLESQNDEWMRKLYEFLKGQRSLWQGAKDLPLIRLEDGTHVRAYTDDEPQAFLPGRTKTSFPTVRATVCSTEDARGFLCELGLHEPDPVDNVIKNILPKYGREKPDILGDAYDADIHHILEAFKTDSQTQRNRLIECLRETPFVWAVDAGDDSKCRACPDALYLATERLKKLFAGITGIKLVDHNCAALRGENIRELLEACGSTRYLKPIADDSMPKEERKEIRRYTTREESFKDWTLRGLDDVLTALPKLAAEEQRMRAKLIWEELRKVASNCKRYDYPFYGSYEWHYRYWHHESFSSAFVRRLNKSEWVPDEEGNLQRPELVFFEKLGWESDPFLESRIPFKEPEVIEQLSKELGVPMTKTELKDLGQFLARMKKKDITIAEMERRILASEPTEQIGHRGGEDHSRGTGSGMAGGKSTPKSVGKGQFISYVAVRPDEEEDDPDGLDQKARMALEAKAINFILSREPKWERTPPKNPGFDLFRKGTDGKPTEWCEVKARKGKFEDRPVELSKRQFECAREHGADYWLYVVEHAGDENAYILRISDPVGKARTFTFDHGWRNVAEMDSKQNEDLEQDAATSNGG